MGVVSSVSGIVGEVNKVGVKVGELRVVVPFVVWWWSGPEFGGRWRRLCVRNQ